VLSLAEIIIDVKTITAQADSVARASAPPWPLLSRKAPAAAVSGTISGHKIRIWLVSGDQEIDT
jgi:hypothetical protein